jgi:CheY-like chemotaxis protein
MARILKFPAHPVVLVVDDEPLVRQLAVMTFEELGFEVRSAAGAAEALDLLDSIPCIKLMFTDICMPGMDGGALVREARERHPGLKVVLTTGWSGTHDIPEGVPIVRKPYFPDDLMLIVPRLLRDTSDGDLGQLAG